jgi:hypothetical protein
MLMIVVLGVWGVAGAERPGLYENKWLMGVGSQGLEFGGSLALSDTQSLFVSVGWMELKLNNVPFFPIPFLAIPEVDWVVAENYHFKSNSFSIGYRWLRQSQPETGRRFLFIPLSDRFKEMCWTFLVKTQTVSNKVQLRFFDAVDIDGIADKKTFITPAFGITNVYRDYQDGNVGNIKYTTNVLLGYNINTKGKQMYPLPKFSVLYSFGYFF